MAVDYTGIMINGTRTPSTVHDDPSMTHGMYRVQSRKDLYEPARQNNFEFIIVASEFENMEHVITKEPISGTNEFDPQEIIRISVITTAVPHFEIKALEQKRGNSSQKFAGEVTWGENKIKLYDWIGINVKEILMSWQHQAYDVHTDKIGLLSDYKRDAFLVEYTPDWQELRKWKMYGCWISNIDEEDFDHSKSEERQISATVQYDKAELLSPDTLIG